MLRRDARAVKMLQLEQLLRGERPAVDGGAILLFTEKGEERLEYEVDTAEQLLRFNGKLGEATTEKFVTGTREAPPEGLLFPNFEATIRAPLGFIHPGMLQFRLFSIEVERGVSGVELLGRNSLEDEGVRLPITVYCNQQQAELVISSDYPPVYQYYTLRMQFSALDKQLYVTRDRGNFAALSSTTVDGVERYPFVRATLSGEVAPYEAYDAPYTTVIPLDLTASEGEVYLHFRPLPAGASLTPYYGGMAGAPLVKLGEPRTVTIGGEPFVEQGYLLPGDVTGAECVTLTLLPHRESGEDVIELKDIVVCVR